MPLEKHTGILQRVPSFKTPKESQVRQQEKTIEEPKTSYEMKPNSLLPFSIGQRPKSHRKRLTLLPKILPRHLRAIPNIRPLAIPQMVLGMRKETRVPQTQQYPRGKERFPVLV